MATNHKSGELETRLRKYTRTHKDLRQITIYTDYPGRADWVVDIRYKDNKQASFGVDYSAKDDMVAVVFDAIKRQMASRQYAPVD